jgi:glycine/D-amino acid oxidase-like deaminating enzyme
VKALIVGGGIIGASRAWRLASEGVAVAVLGKRTAIQVGTVSFEPWLLSHSD